MCRYNTVYMELLVSQIFGHLPKNGIGKVLIVGIEYPDP